MVVKALTAFDTSSEGKCHATKKVTRQVKIDGKKVRLSGRITCRKYLMAHVYHPGKGHTGQFNNKVVEWKLTDKEREGYMQDRKQRIREAQAREAEERSLK